jgi:hypothetical protein
LADPAVEERLGNGVVGPLDNLARSLMPAAAEALDRAGAAESAETVQAARAAQDRVLQEMNAILSNMLKWERFQEAVTLLRDVLKMQGALNQETEGRLESELFGNPPATGPSK